MNPILVVDWRQNFITTLAGFLKDTYGPDLGRCLVVFPNRRPARHLTRALAQLQELWAPDAPLPLLLPEMVSVSELMTRLYAGLQFPPALQAGLLDRCGILLPILQRLEDGGKAAPAGVDPEAGSSRRLFPWCMRLEALLEECLRMGIRPEDIRHAQGMVRPWAATVLENLSALFDAYLHGLDAAKRITPGLQAWHVGQQTSKAAAPLAGRPIILAGFHALAGVEDALFGHLWRELGATLVWHTDPFIALDRAHAHYSVHVHTDQLRRWGAAAKLVGSPSRTPAPKPIRFVQAFDLHSQLGALQSELAAQTSLAETAVALPDNSALIPTLHHLPDQDLNITMGYPLQRTALLELLDTILRAQENARNGLYLWQDILALVRHPYLIGLLPPGVVPYEGQPLRRLFHAVEGVIRQGPKFIEPMDVVSQALASMTTETPQGIEPVHSTTADVAPQHLENFVRFLFHVCLDGFAGQTSLAGLAAALRGLCSALKEHGGALWPRRPLDAEALELLSRRILPELEGSLLSRTELSQNAVFAVLRNYLAEARVPFEAEPLTGLQVIGLLETRLLSFQRLFILDATEDNLPGPVSADPLLPDPLRASIGLPDTRQRDILAAYTFYRLINASSDVTILYQSGVQPGEILDGKAVRSRFVEQLLWEEEKRRGARLAPGQSPLAAVTYAVRPPARPGSPVVRTPPIDARLEELLTKPVSASLLDQFLRCPLRFYFERLCRLKPLEEVTDEGDTAEFGSETHQALRDFLLPWLGAHVWQSELDHRQLAGLISKRLADSGYWQRLSYDRRLALENTIPFRAAGFVSQFPDSTRILLLEENIQGTLEVAGRNVDFLGRLDRVDERNGSHVIVDYKTGSVTSPATSFFEDDLLWEHIEHGATEGFSTSADLSGAPADGIIQLAGSIQMPLYLMLYAAYSGRPDIDLSASWVLLREAGDEHPYFPARLKSESRQLFVEQRAELLVRYAVRRLLEVQEFRPQPGRHCGWCPFAGACDAAKPHGV